ncbi:hypothetical protein IM711_02355 [Microbacterium esteraromaticum]|uniref:hypothetical protein n=1 Tax=Microbacterium esteraromaticum TaxID=57043 RepID=UPI003C2B1E81
MEFDDIGDVDGVPVRVPADDGYRACAVCGGDCELDTWLSANGSGVRIAFVCPEHGVQVVVDPFEHLR